MYYLLLLPTVIHFRCATGAGATLRLRARPFPRFRRVLVSCCPSPRKENIISSSDEHKEHRLPSQTAACYKFSDCSTCQHRQSMSTWARLANQERLSAGTSQKKYELDLCGCKNFGRLFALLVRYSPPDFFPPLEGAAKSDAMVRVVTDKPRNNPPRYRLCTFCHYLLLSYGIPQCDIPLENNEFEDYIFHLPALLDQRTPHRGTSAPAGDNLSLLLKAYLLMAFSGRNYVPFDMRYNWTKNACLTGKFSVPESKDFFLTPEVKQQLSEQKRRVINSGHFNKDAYFETCGDPVALLEESIRRRHSRPLDEERPAAGQDGVDAGNGGIGAATSIPELSEGITDDTERPPEASAGGDEASAEMRVHSDGEGDVLATDTPRDPSVPLSPISIGDRSDAGLSEASPGRQSGSRIPRPVPSGGPGSSTPKSVRGDVSWPSGSRIPVPSRSPRSGTSSGHSTDDRGEHLSSALFDQDDRGSGPDGGSAGRRMSKPSIPITASKKQLPENTVAASGDEENPQPSEFSIDLTIPEQPGEIPPAGVPLKDDYSSGGNRQTPAKQHVIPSTPEDPATPLISGREEDEDLDELSEDAGLRSLNVVGGTDSSAYSEYKYKNRYRPLHNFNSPQDDVPEESGEGVDTNESSEHSTDSNSGRELVSEDSLEEFVKLEKELGCFPGSNKDAVKGQEVAHPVVEQSEPRSAVRTLEIGEQSNNESSSEDSLEEFTMLEDVAEYLNGVINRVVDQENENPDVIEGVSGSTDNDPAVEGDAPVGDNGVEALASSDHPSARDVASAAGPIVEETCQVPAPGLPEASWLPHKALKRKSSGSEDGSEKKKGRAFNNDEGGETVGAPSANLPVTNEDEKVDSTMGGDSGPDVSILGEMSLSESLHEEDLSSVSLSGHRLDDIMAENPLPLENGEDDSSNSSRSRGNSVAGHADTDILTVSRSPSIVISDSILKQGNESGEDHPDTGEVEDAIPPNVLPGDSDSPDIGRPFTIRGRSIFDESDSTGPSDDSEQGSRSEDPQEWENLRGLLDESSVSNASSRVGKSEKPKYGSIGYVEGYPGPLIIDRPKGMEDTEAVDPSTDGPEKSDSALLIGISILVVVSIIAFGFYVLHK